MLVAMDLVDFVSLDADRREPLIQLGLAGFILKLAFPWPYQPVATTRIESFEHLEDMLMSFEHPEALAWHQVAQFAPVITDQRLDITSEADCTLMQGMGLLGCSVTSLQLY